MPFQNQVQISQPVAMEGEFASTNPRRSSLAGPGGFVAGSAGVTIGRFAWADSSQLTVANTGSGSPTGFVARTGQNFKALITTYLTETGMLIPAGADVTLHDGGDFWVKNYGSGAVTYGMKVFVNLTNGTCSFAAAGATVAGSLETTWKAYSVGAAGELIKISNAPTVI